MNNGQRIGLPEELRNGCVLYIPGDVSGTTAFDASGSGNNGTLVNSPTVTRGGLWGYEGFSFNGVNQYLNFGNVLNISGEISIFALIKQNGGTNYERIVSKYFYNYSSFAGYHIQLQNNGILQAGVQNVSSGSTAYYANGTQNLKDGRWHLVGFTWKPYEQIKLYVDGILETISGINGVPPSSISPSSSLLSIGMKDFAGTFYYGNISVVNAAIWNRSISADEVRILHEAFFTP